MPLEIGQTVTLKGCADPVRAIVLEIIATGPGSEDRYVIGYTDRAMHSNGTHQRADFFESDLELAPTEDETALRFVPPIATAQTVRSSNPMRHAWAQPADPDIVDELVRQNQKPRSDTR